MKLKNFAVSVQWGGGYHYFLNYTDDLGKAKNIAKGWKDPRILKKRGVRPKVFIWMKVGEERK